MEVVDLEETRVFKKDFSDYGQIFSVEISPFVLSQDLILIGFETQVLLGRLTIDDHLLGFEPLYSFRHACRCDALSISPETSTNTLPNKIIFITAGRDYNLRIFNSDLKDDHTCNVLRGHTSYINDVKFDPDNNYVVSVSDDHTARLWDCETLTCVATFILTSPGMSACWHREDSSKLLVAEKVGLIRCYNVEARRPVLSLDGGKPLCSMDWALSDPHLVASLQLGEILIWNLTKPCFPVNSALTFTEPGGHIRFSPFGELVAAVNNLEGTLKVVHVYNKQLKLSVPVTIPSNVSWHSRCPILCVGEYKTLTFWRVVSK